MKRLNNIQATETNVGRVASNWYV